MSNNIIFDAKFTKHHANEGVFGKHFFSSKETCGQLNNLEIHIVPGFEVAPHIHEDTSEFFYVVSGTGEFLEDTLWHKIKKGDAFKAPPKMTHSIKNTGNTTLVLFSTFSPPIR